jgi:hypothetical protein
VQTLHLLLKHAVKNVCASFKNNLKRCPCVFSEKMSSVVPPCLHSLIAGASVTADPENVNTLEPPEWMNAALVEIGQKFALRNLSALSFADLLSLIVLLATPEGRKPLVYTNKSSTVFTAFKRYLSTANRYLKLSGKNL